MTATNRPTYAAERRPGDATGLETAARELVAFMVDLGDAYTIAALIEAGAAALKYAPASATNVVELVRRRANYRLGARAARALRAEADRIKATNEHRHAPKRRRRRA